MNVTKLLNLAAVAVPFAASAFGGTGGTSVKTASGGKESFLSSDFIQEGASAFLKTTDAEEKAPFTYVEAERPRSVQELTRGAPTAQYSAAGPVNPLAASGQVQTVLYVLANNARNSAVRDMLREYSVQPTIRQKGVRTSVGRSDIA